MAERARPSPEYVKAKHAEIAKRYAAARSHAKTPRTLASIRAAELTRLYEYRYGRMTLPSDDMGTQAARVMCHHLAHLRYAERRISEWLGIFAPWWDIGSRERLLVDCVEKPIRFKAQTVAWRLRVTAAERTALKLRTIGAIDESPEQRQAKQRIAKRIRDRARRAAAGAKPRAQSLTRQQPWIAAGLSRASWYRRQSKA